jgi:branched-chain amino acid transport system ATP-binding protein
MSKPLISIDHLNVGYGDFQALFDVNMSVTEGEVVSVIGANGAGKTTLMRSITGLLSCEPSMIRSNGDDIGSLRPDKIAARGIAMVPEGRKLFPSLTIEENLIIGGQSGRPGHWNLTRVYELFPVLQERRTMLPASLSGGQQQMVAIGRALMSNPEITLFDEISLGLAPIIIKSIYEVIPKIIGEGMSAIIVEQDIAKALSVSDRVYCLQEGRVSLEGLSSTVSRDEISKAYFGV